MAQVRLDTAQREDVTTARGEIAMTDFWKDYEPITAPAGSYTFAKPPEPVGYWIFDVQGVWKTQLAMYSKPTEQQIKNTEELLGWKWKDAK